VRLGVFDAGLFKPARGEEVAVSLVHAMVAVDAASVRISIWWAVMSGAVTV
jgi:hypothetical protein